MFRSIWAHLRAMIWIRSEVFDHGVFNTSIRHALRSKRRDNDKKKKKKKTRTRITRINEIE